MEYCASQNSTSGFTIFAQWISQIDGLMFVNVMISFGKIDDESKGNWQKTCEDEDQD